ncbi:MAG: insulinase family protein [Alphaproteobacteria bacterium]|nr:insulinase family protein [Alphaproteobacteria bacterium]
MDETTMTRGRIGRLAAAVAFVATLLGGVLSISPASAFEAPETFTLRNGMQVVVISDRRAPVVTHMVWYRVGSADEPRGVSGIAHFLEHLMFKGTRRVGAGAFDETIARNGGEHNAFTSYDYTAYYQRIARDRLEVAMTLEADRMRNLQFDPAMIESERDVIIEERRQRTDNAPSQVLMERMRAMLYPNHPYGTPIIGWLHEMQDLSQEEAEAFYRVWYAPNNAILVVAGDIDAEELRPLAERIYGRLRPTRALPARAWVSDPPAVGPMRVSHADEKVAQPSLLRLYPALSYSTDDGRQAHALDVAMEILGGGATSRLYVALVEEQGIAVNAGVAADLAGIGGGSVALYATPADGVTLEQLEAAADAVIAEYLAEGPSEAETVRARNALAAGAVYARDSQETLANVFGSSLAEGESIEDVVTWEASIRAVGADEALAEARKALDTDRSVTGWLLPAPAAAEEGA